MDEDLTSVFNFDFPILSAIKYSKIDKIAEV